MEDFLIYIGKASIAAAAFYLAFLLLFQNRKQFSFNRIYLPVSFLLSFIIPLITFTTVKYIEITPASFDNQGFDFNVPLSAEPVLAPQFAWEWYHYLFGIFILGLAGFLLNLLLGHLKAIIIIRKSNVVQLFNSAVNITRKDVHPFSFFNKIVLSEKTVDSPNLEMIIEHEKVHVKEKHTFDILISEILFLFQWFNPFAWLLKDAVKNNLEYKTDHEIAKQFNPRTYQLAMVALADKKGVAPFLTALNGSQLKNRIIMMKRKTENKYAFLKQLVILPLLAVLVMGLSNKDVKTEFIQDKSNEHILATKAFKNKIAPELFAKIYKDGLLILEDYGEECPLIVLNDKVVIERVIISETDLKWGEVIQPEQAVEKYGEKGKNGVLVFNTKDEYVGFKPGQEKQIITGKITDENGEPVVGASVVVKGRQYGVLTDHKGNYEIETNKEDNTLIFAYLDIDNKEIEINNKSKINVQLDISKKVETKKDARVKGKLTDGSFQMKNSKEGWGKPLFIVDGKEVENLVDFPTKQLYSLNFLEEELARKYYGLRGKYGAVQIGTKNWKFPSGSKPLIIVDGEEYSGKIEDIPAEKIFQVRELRYPNMIESYGEKGKDGVVEIETNKMKPVGALNRDKEKKASGFYSFGEKTDLNSLSKIKNQNKSEQIPDSIQNKKKMAIGYPSPKKLGPTATYKNSDYEKAGFDFGSFKDVQPYGDPIVIVDGQRYDSLDDAKVDPGDIANLSVLKNETAQSYVKIYGKEALNGVIIINTKTKYNSGNDEVQSKVRNINNDGEPIFYKVEEMPEFPGGEIALREFLQNEMEYPKIAKEAGIQGRVYVTFVITKDGKVTEPEISRGVDPILDKEALRVVSKLPDWKPGKQRGQAVNVSYIVPVNFDLPSLNALNKDATLKTQDVLFIVNGREYKGNLQDIDPETIQSINVLKDAKASEKYGVKGKDGVIEITLKPENITTDLKLRKFIAGKIKYPVEAQKNGVEGEISMAVTFDKNGKIIKTDKSNPKFDDLGEVVVTGSNPENIQPVQDNNSELLRQEMIRIINLMPAVDIAELKGKTINIPLKFQLQYDLGNENSTKNNGYDFTVPEGFSPNGDGIHDVFEIKNLARQFPKFEMKIFDSNRNLIWQYKHKGNSNKTPDWWDGKDKRGQINAGTYFYQIDFNDGSAEMKSGSFILAK